MSFNYNPYKHLNIIYEDGFWFAYCHGCGADSKRAGIQVTIFQPINNLIEWNIQHLLSSHKRRESDFAGWSKY